MQNTNSAYAPTNIYKPPQFLRFLDGRGWKLDEARAFWSNPEVKMYADMYILNIFLHINPCSLLQTCYNRQCNVYAVLLAVQSGSTGAISRRFFDVAVVRCNIFRPGPAGLVCHCATLLLYYLGAGLPLHSKMFAYSTLDYSLLSSPNLLTDRWLFRPKPENLAIT